MKGAVMTNLEKLFTENINTNCSVLEKFVQIWINTLNIFVRKNTQEEQISLSWITKNPSMNKFLTSAHMKRSWLTLISVDFLQVRFAVVVVVG